ncbi:hypothetical protein, partial [Marinomonas gallaica]|uniref:hypothetical protein n=1 Tax=Marinomonas gallaica TaxID=1806667 RepID=UPI003A90565D
LRNVSCRDRQRESNAWHRLAKLLYDPIVSGTRCTPSLREGIRAAPLHICWWEMPCISFACAMSRAETVSANQTRGIA